MPNIIQLLERMGQDATLQNEANFQQAITESTLSTTLKASLLNRDDISLKRELDVCPDIVCIMLPAEDEPEQEEEREEEQDITDQRLSA
ncbi:hypothetical protein L2712_09410 [Shewanella marisflavi]|uniref:hypothetical protein n=1 Tax=Shewanella marisflavi TaxID=260364 RepID=UPI00200C2DD0|nr:hypothetical protein [Shewanella marisflavi]MCL1041856.1 hypothetical protein [Shewanella marisflavi]